MSVVVTLETPELEVDPGSSRDVVVRVRNAGDIVDRFTITVLGDAAGWSSVTPPAVNLFTGAEETVRISFAPPRKWAPRAGRYPYGVFVQSSEHPEDAANEEGAVTVLPFTNATAELVPQTSRGSGRVKHDVTVKNGGNVQVEAQVSASDADRLLRFEVRPDRLVLEPGTAGSTRILVTPNETFLTGPPQSRQFGVTVNSSGQDPFELRGAVLQSARFPSWLPRAVAGIAALAIVGGVLAATGVIPPRPTPSPTASEAAVATLTPSPSPSLAPTPSVAPVSEPPPPPSEPAGPSPTPTPGEFVLAPIPDPGITSGALSSKPDCDLSQGASCYQTAVDTIVAMLSGLGGPYGGKGVVSLTTTQAPDVLTLPIIMQRDGVFGWRAQEGAVQGQTPYVVLDLAPLIAEQKGFAYAVVQANPDDVLVERYLLPDELAQQLLGTIYTVNPEMVPEEPIRSFPPIFQTFDPGILEWRDFEIQQ
jgi:hypothetical protein